VEIEPCNEVRLVGRVAGDPMEVELPSGDRLTSFKVVVDRAPSRRPVPPGVRQPTVDTLDCVIWMNGLQRTAQTWGSGDVVEVTGALRRRFWRAGGAPTSKCEVEVVKAKRLIKAA
jgi:single-strand DNA-binding protein